MTDNWRLVNYRLSQLKLLTAHLLLADKNSVTQFPLMMFIGAHLCDLKIVLTSHNYVIDSS